LSHPGLAAFSASARWTAACSQLLSGAALSRSTPGSPPTCRPSIRAARSAFTLNVTPDRLAAIMRHYTEEQ